VSVIVGMVGIWVHGVEDRDDDDDDGLQHIQNDIDCVFFNDIIGINDDIDSSLISCNIY